MAQGQLASTTLGRTSVSPLAARPPIAAAATSAGVASVVRLAETKRSAAETARSVRMALAPVWSATLRRNVRQATIASVGAVSPPRCQTQEWTRLRQATAETVALATASAETAPVFPPARTAVPAARRRWFAHRSSMGAASPPFASTPSRRWSFWRGPAQATTNASRALALRGSAPRFATMMAIAFPGTPAG